MTLQSREAKIETSIDNRHRRRHRLLLELEARNLSAESSAVTVYDISNTGLLIETSSSLAVGEMIEVGLPRIGFQMAEIVWASGHLVGCKFTQEITQGAVSAARLEGGHKVATDFKLDYASAAETEADRQATDTSAEKMPLGLTLRIILGLAVLAWLVALTIGNVIMV